MDTMFLSDDEIERLTGRKRKKQQIDVLEALGVIFVVNGINELIVSRSHIESKLGGDEDQRSSQKSPNYSMFLQ